MLRRKLQFKSSKTGGKTNSLLSLTT